MLITYTPTDPADGEARTWAFNPRRIKATVCVAIEKVAGRPYADWAEAALHGDVAAVRVLLWYVMKQEHPVLRFEDTPDFYIDEVVVESDVDELREMRDNAVSMPLKPGVTEAERAELLATIDREIESKTAAHGPKAL